MPFPAPTRQGPPVNHAKPPDQAEGTAYLEYLLELADEFYRIHDSPANDQAA